MISKSISKFKILAFAMLLSIATLTSNSAQAQTDPARTVVDNYIAAQHSMQWKTMAKYLDPGDLSRFKATFQSIFSPVIAQVDTTALRPSYFGIKSLSELPGVDSLSYFAGVFTLVFELYPQMRQMAATADNKVLGSVNEGESMKHYVLRTNSVVQNEKVSTVEVTTLHKVGANWYVLSGRSMDQMAALVKRTLR